MKTDYLDLVQFHISPSRQTLEENGALDALLELQTAGRVRFIGMSGTLPHLRDHITMGVFDVFQIPYSAVEREHEAIIAAASKAGATAAAPPKAHRQRESRPGCIGTAGGKPGSTTCSME
jgi:aryl-alcohol dehydrogenase-like predicted oxidoreductase